MSILQVQFHLMLYIQMQLCERSLKDWIQARNFTLKSELTMSTGKFNGWLTGRDYLLCIIILVISLYNGRKSWDSIENAN